MAPSQDASDHREFHIFSRRSLETFICHCYWEGATLKGYDIDDPFVVDFGIQIDEVFALQIV